MADHDETQLQAAKPIAQSASTGTDRNAPAEERSADPVRADAPVNKKMPGHEAADATVLDASRKHTRRSFAIAAVGAAAGYGFWRWAEDSPSDDMQPTPIRRPFESNASSRASSPASMRSRPPTRSAAPRRCASTASTG